MASRREVARFRHQSARTELAYGEGMARAEGGAVLDGREIVTIEGLGSPEKLHAMQAAFLEKDAYQCGSTFADTRKMRTIWSSSAVSVPRMVIGPSAETSSGMLCVRAASM